MTDEELTDLIAEKLYDGNFVTAKESQFAASELLTALREANVLPPAGSWPLLFPAPPENVI